MFGISSGYLVILVFLLVAAGLILAEAYWLSRGKWAGYGKAFAFSLITNSIGIVLSITAFFVVMMFMLAMTWDGNNKHEFPMGSTGENIVILVAIGFIFLLLVGIKRLLMRLFGFPVKKPSWVYSIISTFLIGALLIAIPGFIIYLSNRT